MLFIVKPNVDMTKYNFVDMGANHWWWRNNRRRYRGAINLCYDELSKRIIIYSASSDAVALLCEMYKNGDIDILPEDEFVNMKLTQEEADLIEERRKSK